MPVVLLVHCDGTAGSGTFTDVSASNHSLLASLTSVNATAKFGSGAAFFSAGSANITASGTLTDFNFGAGQFTVEAWGYYTGTPGTVSTIAAQWQGSSNLGWSFAIVSGALGFYYSTTGTDNPNVGAAFSPTLNTWYHLAADRDASNVLRVYVNGSVIASATVASTFFASTLSLLIGNDGNGGRVFTGLLDEVRVVKGQAMYGGAFTPPSAPFPSFTTWNPSDLTNVTLSGGNLVATASAINGGVRGKDPKRSGKFYIEFTVPTTQSNSNIFGFASRRTTLGTLSTQAIATVQYQTGALQLFDVFGVQITGQPVVGALSGTVLCAAIDLDARLVWFRVNAGNWNGSASNNPATGVGGSNIAAVGHGQGIDVYPFAFMATSGNNVTANFGASAFAQSVPSGYTSGWDDSVAAVSYAVATQMAVEEWARAPTVYARLTQIAVEEWASVTLGPYPVASDQARALILA